MKTDVIRTYLDYFLPREVVGPVVIVFSLEGVIDGLFTQFVPAVYETLGWALVFVVAIVGVAVWGATDDEAMEELAEDLEEVREGA